MADADWENEDFEPKVFAKPAVAADRWEGEDEEDDVKDNWDDDEEKEEKEKQDQSMIAVQPKKKKSLAAIIAEKEEKRRKELEEKKRWAAEMESKELTPEEALAYKLKQQKLEEEADLQLAKETFGVTDPVPELDNLSLSSKEDFDNFRKALIDKLSRSESSIHYVSFMEDLCRDLCLNLQVDDIKKITGTLNALAHEKVKAQKAARAKKKSKKATLNVGKEDFTIMDYGDEYEDCI